MRNEFDNQRNDLLAFGFLSQKIGFKRHKCLQKELKLYNQKFTLKELSLSLQREKYIMLWRENFPWNI